ncbi:MAG: hypothetical protein AAF670_03735 [Planctomycetota bacterium]
MSDPSLVNEIVACPSCGSLVQINPPTEAIDGESLARSSKIVVGDASVDSGELTHEAIPSIAETTSIDRADQRAPNDDSASTSDALDDPKWDVAFQSETSARQRRRLLRGAAIVSGVVAAVSLAIYGWQVLRDDETVASTPSFTNEMAALAEPSLPVPASESQTDSPGTLTDTFDAESRGPLSSTKLDETPQTGPDGPTTSADDMASPDGLASSPDLVLGNPMDLLDRTNDVGQLGGKESADDSTVLRPTKIDDAVDGDAESATLTEMPPELARFTELLDLPGDFDAMAEPEGPNEDPPLILDQAAREVIDPMLIATPPPNVNVDNAMKLRIAINTDGYQLADATLMISEITAVPVQLDWVTLDLAGIDIRQPVRDLAPGFKSVGQLVDGLVESAGALLVERSDDRLTLTVPLDRLRESTQPLTAIDAFDVDGASAQELVENIVQVVKSRSVVTPHQQLHFQVILMQSLRRLRGLPVQLDPDVMSRWTGPAPSLIQDSESLQQDPRPLETMWPILRGGESGTQLDGAITLAGCLRRTARLNDASCVINWNDAQRRKLSPAQLVMPYAGEPAGEMLTRTLNPIGLQIRRVDDRHWWVGTEATYDQLPIIVLGDALGPDRDLVTEALFQAAASAGTQIVIEHDPVSGGYLAVMPRFFYRQTPLVLRRFMRSR